MADRIQALLEPTIAGLGYELWGIERARNGDAQVLRLYIDHANGITLDDCERVSRQVSDVLEVAQAMRGEYLLEVSSPGIDRPLFTLEQHRRHVGEHVRLRLRQRVAGRRRLRGVLRAVTEDAVVVEENGETFTVPFGDIERARLEAEWEYAPAPTAGSKGRAGKSG